MVLPLPKGDRISTWFDNTDNLYYVGGDVKPYSLLTQYTVQTDQQNSSTSIVIFTTLLYDCMLPRKF